MGGGSDVLIVGIVGKDLEDRLEAVASPRRLEKLFGGNFPRDPNADKHYQYVHRLEEDPDTDTPGLFYIIGENLWGAVSGAGLGYVLFSGNNDAPPKKLDEKVFARIPELKERFVKELASHGLNAADYQVGVHAINVYDT